MRKEGKHQTCVLVKSSENLYMRLTSWRLTLQALSLLGLIEVMDLLEWTLGWIGLLVSFDFGVCCVSYHYSVLAKYHFDHHSLLFTCSFVRRYVSRFRFQRMWLTHHSLQQVIKDQWRVAHPSLPPIQLLLWKLRALQPILELGIGKSLAILRLISD